MSHRKMVSFPTSPI